MSNNTWTTSTALRARIDVTAQRIAELGIERVERGVSELIQAALRHSLSPVLVAVLGDATAPPVARERAFGRLATELDSLLATPGAVSVAA